MKPSVPEVEAVLHVERPWGAFDQFLSNNVGTVKVISVEPHQRLSLQKHQLRDELWRILDGPVEVTVGDETWKAVHDSIVWVPRNTVHRISNPSPLPIRILEIAFGTFDEDDIERLQDDYLRGLGD